MCTACGTKSKGRGNGKRLNGPNGEKANKKRRIAKPVEIKRAEPVGPVFLSHTPSSTRLRVEVRTLVTATRAG